MATLRCVLLALLVMPFAAVGQTRIPLEITHIGDDAAGRTVVQALREAIRTFDMLATPLQLEARDAFGMRLTTQLARPRIKLQLVTSELDASRTAIAVSVIYDSPDMPLGGAFIRSAVETCKAEEGSACASRILARAHAAIGWLRENWPSLWKTL